MNFLNKKEFNKQQTDVKHRNYNSYEKSLISYERRDRQYRCCYDITKTRI